MFSFYSRALMTPMVTVNAAKLYNVIFLALFFSSSGFDFPSELIRIILLDMFVYGPTKI